MSEVEKKFKVKLCSLWQKEFTKRDGQTFTVLSGTLGDCYISVTKNPFTELGTTNKPTHTVYLESKFKKNTEKIPNDEKKIDDIQF
jgi:hypothetical protein